MSVCADDALILLDQLTLFLVALAANTLSALAGGGLGLLQLPALIFPQNRLSCHWA